MSQPHASGSEYTLSLTRHTDNAQWHTLFVLYNTCLVLCCLCLLLGSDLPHSRRQSQQVLFFLFYSAHTTGIHLWRFFRSYFWLVGTIVFFGSKAHPVIRHFLCITVGNQATATNTLKIITLCVIEIFYSSPVDFRAGQCKEIISLSRCETIYCLGYWISFYCDME